MTGEANYPLKAAGEVSHLVPVSTHKDLARKRTKVRSKRRGGRGGGRQSPRQDTDGYEQDGQDDGQEHRIDYLV